MLAKIVEAGRLNGKLLLYNGFLYARNRTTAAKIHWRCNVSACGVLVQTCLFDVSRLDAEVAVITEPKDHKHPPTRETYAAQARLVGEMASIVMVCHAVTCSTLYGNAAVSTSKILADHK